MDEVEAAQMQREASDAAAERMHDETLTEFKYARASFAEQLEQDRERSQRLHAEHMAVLGRIADALERVAAALDHR